MWNKEWILQKAAEEENAFFGVGDSASAIWKSEKTTDSADCVESVELPSAVRPAEALAARVSFSKFVRHARLRRSLTAEEFAENVHIPLEEVVCIETDDAYVPPPRTVHCLSRYLNVSPVKLLTLAGLAVARDADFYAAPVRYAAKSQPVRQLTTAEQEAFDEFVRFLSDR